MFDRDATANRFNDCVEFVLLAALANPAEGMVSRILLILLEGATLGTLNQPASDPAAGYVAFFVLVLFLFGLAMLPSRRARQSTDVVELSESPM